MSAVDPKLSGVMRLCLQRTERHGRLVKSRGGFWHGDGEASPSRAGGFMTSTVSALVQRGLLRFTDYKNSAPVAAERVAGRSA